MTEPQISVYPLREENTYKRTQAWEWEIIQDAEIYDAPYKTSRERNKIDTQSNYVVLLCEIIDALPSIY